MESNGKIMSMTPPKDAPKEGDFVQLTYCAYIWDCQKQVVVEFAASDNPSKIAPEAGPMEFFVGRGETIKGIDYAVQRLKKGESCRLIITPALAYGAVGVPPDIPPHSHVMYDITLDNFGRDEAADEPPAESKPSKPSSKKPSAPASAPAIPPPPGGGGGGGGSLAEAIALRRAKVDAGTVAGPMTVAERAPRANRMTQRVQQGTGAGGKEPELRGPAVEKESDKPKVEKMYTLKELQDIVRDKRMDELGLDAGSIEDALTDSEFEKAFKMSRTDFLLKPRWRQQALKRGVRLF
jgi:hypothetical protein